MTTARLTLRNLLVGALLVALALVPVYSHLTGDVFMTTLCTRIVIFAIAAVSLNLIMGFGGMVSFGHAVYLGIGGYAVGILSHEGVVSGFVQWPVAVLVSGLMALIIGVLSLRTRGVYFIMITLAFAQMVYYVAVSLDRYGGDDGLTIYDRSDFGGLIDMSNRTVFYYVCFVVLLATCYLVWRIVRSRFGMVIQGARSNDRRMKAIGFPTFRYRLTCFVIAGMICGLAGALSASHTDFISPAVMHWMVSGELIVMAVLGGMGSVLGPVVGTVTFLAMEELLPWLIDFISRLLTGEAVAGAREYWRMILGPMLIVVVLYARGGIDGILTGRGRG